ncbi:MAG TPA: nickel pincer cofactor biosynthesis protein LarC [Ktedonobacteraceae bacterium]|nr:nickel pincer cofactor biosynthesis protein LarC [Ktedonobacteraceae bacterium]
MSQLIAYLDCNSGISGDMFLGAMLDLDASFSLDSLKSALSALPLHGYQLKLEPFHDKGIRGLRFDVVLSEQDATLQQTRHLSDIATLLNTSTLSLRVRETALAIFQCLAEAEAAVHGTAIEEVHFHEVGAIDSIIDIVGAAIAIETLGITQLYASPLPLTSGYVKTAHGLLPVPAPATLEILRRVAAPWKPSTAEGELVTPTGAAILATLARFQTPAISIEHVGYGFGQKQLPWPNCLRLCLGRARHPLQSTDQANTITGVPDTDWVTIIESNIDNMTGELLGGLMDRLIAAGALDVSYTPIQMKKNRPAVMVTIICPVEEGDALAQVLLSESSTLGVRISQVQRLKAQRTIERIETPIGPMPVKVKRLGARIISAAPEYEECQRLALEHNLPLAEVYQIAQHVIEATLLPGLLQNRKHQATNQG